MNRDILALACGIALFAGGWTGALPSSGPIRWDGGEDGGLAKLAVARRRPPIARFNADLEICSGSVVGLSDDDDAPAVVLSNGHCVGMPRRASHVRDMPFERDIALLTPRGEETAAKTRRVIYATTAGTDISLLELAQTYREVKKAGVRVFSISREPAKPGDAVIVYSGISLFRSAQRCRIGAIVHHLREDAWDWFGSYKLDGCAGEHGMSGSPMIAEATGEVVGVLNTGNDDGERCTLDNPCEIDERGRVSFRKGTVYGQRVDQILGCLDPRGRFDLNAASCRLTGAR